jgi:hypothetical protein
MEIIFLGFQEISLTQEQHYLRGVKTFAQVCCKRETLSSGLKSLKHLAITTSFNGSLSGFKGHLNISVMASGLIR